MAQTPTNEALYGSDKDDTTFSSSTSELGGAVGTETPPDETPEEHQRRMHEMEEELLKVESEIAMLRQVLGSKVRHATELKRELGITPFQEFKHDFQQGLEHIKNSESYQKTSSVVKTATEKTSSAINSMGQAVVKKMGDIKKSQTFKSFDEKVHTTYANVKVSGSDDTEDKPVQM
uniref:Tumor protein D52 n=1 Tax=Arion vulgaris TaxID=1028688 RepID=A0A0B7ARZ2_9EUPU